MFARKQTVDGIMSGFQKTIEKLENLSYNASIDIDILTEQRVKIEDQIQTTEEEAKRAESIVAKLRNLTGVKT